MARSLGLALLLLCIGCGSDDGFHLDLNGDPEPPPFIENGFFCGGTDSYWSCSSGSGAEIDFVAYDEANGGLFGDADAEGTGLLVVRAAGSGEESSSTFDYDKPKKTRVDFVLADQREVNLNHVQGAEEIGILSFDIEGIGFSGQSFNCELVNGLLDGDCDGEPGGERTPLPCEIALPSQTPILICTPTATPTPLPMP